MTLAEQIKQVMEKYEAMVAEGEALAASRKEKFGDWQPDTSGFVTLTDYKPAYTAWKATQSDMVDIIRQLTDIVKQQHEALVLAQSAMREVDHAQENGANWYTRGDSGLFQQIWMWMDKARKPTADALALSAPIVKGVE